MVRLVEGPRHLKAGMKTDPAAVSADDAKGAGGDER